METRAVTRFIRLSPRKVRLVVDQIRGKGVEEALNTLKFTPKRAADLVGELGRQRIDGDDLHRIFARRGHGAVAALGDCAALRH